MNVVPFNFNETEVRSVIGNDNEPWFVAKDVCDCLGLKNVKTSVSKLDEEDKGIQSLNTLGGNQNMIVVNESGLYHLIFASYKEEAKAFKRWVTKEVLPTIRKTGSYSLYGKHDTVAFYKEYQRLNPNYEIAIEFNGIIATAFEDVTHDLLITGVELAKLIGKSPTTVRLTKLHNKDIITEGRAFVSLGQTTYWTRKGIEIVSLHSRNKDFAKYIHGGEFDTRLLSA